MLRLAVARDGRVVGSKTQFEAGRAGRARLRAELRRDRAGQGRMQDERIGGDPADQPAPQAHLALSKPCHPKPPTAGCILRRPPQGVQRLRRSSLALGAAPCALPPACRSR